MRRALTFWLCLVIGFASLTFLGSSPSSAATSRSVTIAASPTIVVAGSTTTLTGRVTRTPARSSVQIQRKSGTTWKRIATVRTTDKSGHFKYVLKPPTTAAKYYYRAYAPKSTKLRAASSKAVTVTVLKKVTVAAGASPIESTIGETVTFAGTIAPFRVGSQVFLQRRVNDSWVSVTSTGVTSTGTVTFAQHPLAGIWQYRLYKPRDGYHASAASATMNVDIAGPASLEVQIVNLPNGQVPNVVVQGPDVLEQLDAGKTFQNAKAGSWKVDAANLVSDDVAYWAVTPNQTVTLARGQSQVVVVDYSVATPTTTKVVADTQQVTATETEDGIYDVSVAPPTNSAARTRTTMLQRNASAVAASEFGICQYKSGDNVAMPPSAAFPEGGIGKATNEQCLESGIEQFRFDTTAGVTYADMLGSSSGTGLRIPENLRTLRISGADQVETGGKFYRAINAATIRARNVDPGTLVPTTQTPTSTVACTGGGSITVSGDLELTPTLSFNPEWGTWADPGLKSLSATAALDEKSTLTVSASGKATCSTTDFNLGTVYFAPMYFTLGIPIVVTPELDIKASASMTAEAKGSVVLREEASVSGDLAWDAANGATFQSHATPPTIKTDEFRRDLNIIGEVDANAKLRAELHFRFNGVGDAQAYAEGNLDFAGKVAGSADNVTADWGLTPSFRAGVKFGLGNAGLGIFGWTITTPDYDLLTWNGCPLISGGWIDPDQPEIKTATLPDGAMGTAYSARLETKDNRQGGWDITSGQLPSGVVLDHNNGMITGVPTTAVNSTFTATFSDGCGRNTSKAFQVQVTGNLTGAPGTTLESVTDSARSGNSHSYAPSLSPDGRFLAFATSATDIANVPSDSNGKTDIVRRDLETGINTLVSVGKNGQANGDSLEPAISADGRYVAYSSSATNLDPRDTGSERDIYVWDSITGDSTLVSNSSTGAGGNHDSRGPKISADGSRIVFQSSADNLVAGDSNSSDDVFLWRRSTGDPTLVSVNPETGHSANNASLTPDISSDGTTIVFVSPATDLKIDGPMLDDVYVINVDSGGYATAPWSPNGSNSGFLAANRSSVSADGQFVLYTTTSLSGGFTRYVWNRDSGSPTRLLSDLTVANTGGISSDGKTVVVKVTKSAGVTGWGTLDRDTGHVSLLDSGGLGFPSPALEFGAISLNGAVVAFAAASDTVTPRDSNRSADVFVWRRPNG